MFNQAECRDSFCIPRWRPKFSEFWSAYIKPCDRLPFSHLTRPDERAAVAEVILTLIDHDAQSIMVVLNRTWPATIGKTFILSTRAWQWVNTISETPTEELKTRWGATSMVVLVIDE